MAEKILQTPKQDNTQHTPKRSKILTQNSLDFEDKENSEIMVRTLLNLLSQFMKFNLYHIHTQCLINI